MEEWDKATEYSSDLNDLYEDLYKMLRGQRPDKQYDWQSNVVINKVFQVIWTAIPYLMQKIFGANPIIGIGSIDKKGAYQRSRLLEFWYTMNHRKCQPFYTTMVMWTLRGLLNGVGVLKKTWYQELKTKSLEEQVEVPMVMDELGNEIETEPHTTKKKISVPICDFPKNEIVNNKDIRFDWALKPGERIGDGRFVIHRTITDLNELKKSKLYENLDDIVPGSGKLEEDHADLKSLDGQDTMPKSDFYTDIEIYERQGLLPVTSKDGKYEYDEDGDQKQMVCTVALASVDDQKKYTVIRLKPNPYGEIGYIDMQIYYDPERWQSIGAIEPFKDIQSAMNDNINAMFDEIWQNLMPPVVVDKNALWDWDTMIYAPQQRWLTSGNPRESILFKEPSKITSDAWQKHVLFDSEIQLTSAVTPPMQGAGREKAATTNILNAQMSAGKLDFVLKMIETTALIPNAQMDIRFAKKFAHKLTAFKILGEPFQFGGPDDFYKYIPAASSVKLEHQKEREIQEDIQMIQVLMNINNPKTPAVVNMLLQNILRNRNMPKEAALFDEEYFEPQTEAGQLSQLEDKLGGYDNNQNGIPASTKERTVREATNSPRGMVNY